MKTDNQNYFRTLFLVWTICFFLLLSAYLILLKPAQKNSRMLGKQLAEKKQIYDLILQTEQEQTKLQLTREIDGLRDGLHKYVVEPRRMADLIFNISQIANEKKVESFNIKSRETNKGSASRKSNYISEDYIDVSFETTFNNFASILNSLERNEPVVFVDKFSINRSDGKPAAGRVRMNLAVFASQKNISPAPKIKLATEGENINSGTEDTEINKKTNIYSNELSKALR